MRVECRQSAMPSLLLGQTGTDHRVGGAPEQLCAGIQHRQGVRIGWMHAVEPGFGPDSEAGPRTGTDGLRLFRSVIGALAGA